MKSAITITVIVLLFWGLSLFFFPLYPLSSPLILRKELLNLSGILSICYMCAIMVLACRPLWLEKLMGGLDKMYHQHKWLGISATIMAFVHYLLKHGKGFFNLFVSESSLKIKYANKIASLSFFRSPAKELGEWMLWILLVMVLITLWKRFPYKWWRYGHKLLSILFLIVAFHSLVLMPLHYWSQPIGWLTTCFMIIGIIYALMALTGTSHKKRQYPATIISISTPNIDLVEITCRLRQPQSLFPGQFVFLQIKPHSEWHPFSLSSYDKSGQEIRFSVKRSGDFTRKIDRYLDVNQHIMIEGPYGRFLPKPKIHPQIWIATGIGITPFLAWLHYFQQHPKQVPSAQLIYCIKNPEHIYYREELERLISELPSISLKYHYSSTQGRLTDLNALAIPHQQWQKISIWFCGPTQMAKTLRYQFKSLGGKARRFHTEYFEFR